MMGDLLAGLSRWATMTYHRNGVSGLGFEVRIAEGGLCVEFIEMVDEKFVDREWVEEYKLPTVPIGAACPGYERDDMSKTVWVPCVCMEAGMVYSDAGDPDHDGSPDECPHCDHTGELPREVYEALKEKP